MHHSFDVDLATELKSVDLAILVHHFQYWIRHNAAMGINSHDGRTWTYQTLKHIASHFDYWNVKQVEKLMVKLVDMKILIKGNYNKTPYERTIWYAFNDQVKFNIIIPISLNREMEDPKQGNGNPHLGKCNITDSIPNTITHKEHTLPSHCTADADVCVSSLPKISDEAKQFAEDFLGEIKRFKADYVKPNTPKNQPSWAQAAQDMILKDKRDPKKVLQVLRWALNDNEIRGKWSGWSKLVIGVKNPIAYMREKYDTIDTAMDSKPAIEGRDRRTKNMDGTPIDAPHLKDLF